MISGMLSKRQVLRTYGFNDRTFKRLIADGVIQVEIKPGKRPRVFVEEGSLKGLLEGEHYVVCQACGAWQFQMTSKHLKSCTGMMLKEYQERFPEAQILSAYSSRNKQKTKAQKEAQSENLRKRFRRPEGDITRRQISDASKRMQKNGYREVAASHLRAYGRSEKGRHLRQQLTQQRWEHGDFREVVEKWHEEHREQSLASVANARRHMKKTSSVHLRFKEALKEAGVQGFETEYPVAWYSIDEAHPKLKVAIEVDGCFWHGCKKCGLEGTDRIRRIDKAKTTYLERRGWVVWRIPEHDIQKNVSRVAENVKIRLREFLT